MDNIKEYVVNYKPNRIPVVSGLEQWDFGQYLVIKDIPLELLEDEKEMHFCFPDSLKSVVVKAEYEDNVLKAKIPKFIFQKQIESCLYSSYKAYAFVYLKTNEYGKTIYKIALEIEARPKPDDYEYEEEQLYFEELTEVLDAKADNIKYSGNILYLLSGEHVLSRVTIKSGSGGGTGTGTDGREIELRNNGTYIQWRYVGDEEWNNLVALSDLNGKDGMTPYIDNGDWYIGEQNTGVKAQGVDGRGIKNLEKIETKENIDTYKITFTDDTEFIYEVVNAPIGAIVEETDPTVPEWAKQDKKPTYTAKEVGALPADTKIPSKTSDLENDSYYVTETELNVVKTDLTDLTKDYNDNKEFIITVTRYVGGVYNADKTFEEILEADEAEKHLIVIYNHIRFECVDTKSGVNIYFFDNVAIESNSEVITRKRIVIKEDIIEYYEDTINLTGTNISKEDIKNAVNEYFDANPVQSGATKEQEEQIQKNKEDIGKLSQTNEKNTERSKYNRVVLEQLNGVFDFKYANTLEYNILDIQNIFTYDKPNSFGMYKLFDISPTKGNLDLNGITFTYKDYSLNGTEKTITIPRDSMAEESGILIGFNGETPVFMSVPKDGVETEDASFEGGFYATLMFDGALLSKVDFKTYDIMLYKLKNGGSGATAEQLAQIEKNTQDIGKLSETVADKATLVNGVIKFYKTGETDTELFSVDISSIGGTGGLDLANLTLSVSQVGEYQRLSMSDGTTTKTVDIPITAISDEQVQTAVETWLNEHPEATTTIADSSITVDKLAAYKGEVVRNMFGNMGFEFGTIDSTTNLPVVDENSMHLLVYTKLEPSTTYYMQRNNKGVLENIAPLDLKFYDEEDNYLSKAYTWDGKFKTPADTSYGVMDIKSNRTAERAYYYQPYQLMDKTITGIYPYAYIETLYANDLSKEKDLINTIIDEQQETIAEKVTNYFVKGQDIIAEVNSGDVFTTNLFQLIGKYFVDAECQIGAEYDMVRVNDAVTGEKPQAVQITIPNGVSYVKFFANNGDYPNATQNEWYQLENPQIVKGTKLFDNIEQGKNVKFIEEAEAEVKKIAKNKVDETLQAIGVVSPLSNKKWMVFGDSTSCYSEKNYPDYITERTGCLVFNKAMAGSRITANESSGNPIVNIVVNDITSDVEVLTLIGGYNDRRSYDASNPNWDWLGSMLGADGKPNTDKTTFYGALNMIASKWFEVCPEATKAWFTIFPCGTNPNGEYETKINGIIKEVANYWCIPCFDAWNEVGLPVRLDYINQTYYMNDRIHPNEEGNRVISVYVQKKLESIMV